jgi:putative flippase GtrA
VSGGRTAVVRTRGPRYATVTAANVILGQIVLFALLSALPQYPRWLITGATVIGCAFPTYYANRAWVWEKRGPSSLRREVGPFWTFVALGLVGTTGGVAVAEAIWNATRDGVLPAIVANLVNFTVIGTLWVIRFFWMDRAFGPADPAADPGRRPAAPPASAEVATTSPPKGAR